MFFLNLPPESGVENFDRDGHVAPTLLTDAGSTTKEINHFFNIKNLSFKIYRTKNRHIEILVLLGIP